MLFASKVHTRLAGESSGTVSVLCGWRFNYFWHEGFCRHIMPAHYSHHGAMVRVSGLAEILGGLGLLAPA